MKKTEIYSKQLLLILLALFGFNKFSICQSQPLPSQQKANTNLPFTQPTPNSDTFPHFGSNRVSFFYTKERNRTPNNIIQKPGYLSNQYSGKKISSKVTGNIAIDLTVTNPSCGFGSGSIIAEASGGVAPYSYLLRSTNLTLAPRSEGYFINLPSDDYLLKVTDANGQSTETIISLNNELPAVHLGLAYAVPSECGKANGIATLQATGGTPPYEYSMDRLNWQPSNVFKNLSFGFYYFAVRDANGCESWYFNFADLDLFGCSEPAGGGWSLGVCDQEGNANMSANGTEGPYQYSIDGINFYDKGDFENLGHGIHTIHMKDKNGKIYLLSFNIFKMCQVNLEYTSTDANCKQNDGKFTITASNGSAPYTYTIDGIHYQPDNTFTNLAPGTYTVTAKDATGNTNSLNVIVYERCPALEVFASMAACSGTNGSIVANATNGTEPYQFSIDGNNFQTSNIFNGLGTGNYTIIVKDALGFRSTATINIDAECLAINTEQENVVCGNHNGSVRITAAGGKKPYSYSINGINFQSDSLITGLEAGNYVLTVKDSDGITATKNITITDTPGPTLTVTETLTSCNLIDGAITIHATGGTPPYMYSMNGVYYQFSNTFTGVSSDPYRAIVKDANGCINGVGGWLLFNCVYVDTEIKTATCGAHDGSVKATARGGVEPYQYSIDGMNFRNENVFYDLAPGTYTITVKAFDGKLKTSDFVIADACIDIIATPLPSTCNKSNGSIKITASLGTTPYTYSVDGINFQSENIITGLAAATYTVTVKDANGLTSTSSTTVNNISGPQVSAITSPASCMNNDGYITINAINGVSPFMYSIDGSTYQDKNIFDRLKGESYTTYVKDANGCIASQSAVVSNTNNLSINAGVDSRICEGENITLSPTSNATTFKWSPSLGLNNDAIKNAIASPVSTIQYTVTATLGICSAVDDVVVHVDPSPVAIVNRDSAICFGQNITLNGQGGVTFHWTPSTYLDNPDSNQPVVEKPVSTTTYYLEVTDTKGCKSVVPASVTITVTPPAKVFAGNDTAVVMNQPFQLNAIDINNSGFTHFLWSPSYNMNNPNLQNPIVVPDKNTNYTVKAITQSGCEGSDAIIVKVFQGPEIYVPNAFTPGTDGLNDVLKPVPVGIKTFKYFAVYNRWGTRIFYTSDPLKGWDGKVNGVPQNTGTFVWRTEGEDIQGITIKRQGPVTLIR